MVAVLRGAAVEVSAAEAEVAVACAELRAIVDDDVGTVQVDTLGQHITGDDDVVVVTLFFFVIRVKIGLDIVALALAVASTN